MGCVVSNVILIEAEVTDFSFIMSKTNIVLSKKFTQREEMINVSTGSKHSSDLGSTVNFDELICIND